MIEVKQVKKTFGEAESITRALKEINLTIQQGEMVSIMGPSGCGKTTLLHVLAGIEQPDEGEVWSSETPLHQLNDQQLSQYRLEHMGFVFQQYHLIPVLTALENVALPLTARGFSDKESRDRALKALEEVGLGEKATRYPSELSGGQNQRIAIARAIVGQPQVILADEPTGALDSKTTTQIVGLLKQIHTSLGTTIIMVTHEREVAGVADRIIFMENGRIVDERGSLHV